MRPRPGTSSRCYYGSKSAATFKKGIFVHPLWVPNCMQNLKGGWKFSFPMMFDPYRDLFLIHSFNFSLRGTLGFSVLRFWLFLVRFFGFCAKKLRFFSFWSSLRFADFPFFSMWFSVFAKNTNGFSDLISDAVFGFSYLTFLGSGFSSIWAAITRLHWSRIAAKRKCYREECVTNQLKYRRDPQVASGNVPYLDVPCV